jgi:cytochrome bd-type quinol oxidase subunit 2
MSDFLDLHDDAVSRRVLFMIAALLITVPFVQAGAQIWPLQLTNIQWRFGAANAFSSILLLPFLGLSLLLLLARGLENRGLARVVGGLSAIFTVGLLGSLVVFVLDSQELKTIVSTQMSAQFNSTTIRVGFVTLLFLLAFSFLTLSSFAAVGGTTDRRPRSAAKAAPKSGNDSDEDMMIVGLREG